MEDTYRAVGVRVRGRTAEEFGRTFFSGLELVPPGVVLTSEWRPAAPGPPAAAGRSERLRRRRPQARVAVGRRTPLTGRIYRSLTVPYIVIDGGRLAAGAH
jgi:S-adenosyl methyltransferase